MTGSGTLGIEHGKIDRVDRDTAYWKQYRAYARQKASAHMALILVPFSLVVSFGWAMQTSGYAPSDPRSDILWRLGVMAAFDLFSLAGLAWSIRWLLADRRGEKRPLLPDRDDLPPPG